jgi:hypothetical protein
MQISSPRTEVVLSAIQRGIGVFLLASAAACFAAWFSGRGEHGEIAFLWLYSSAALPIGAGMYAAGQALRSQGRHRWWWQIAAILPAVACWALLRITLMPS